MSCQTLDGRFKRGRAGTFAHEQAQPLVKARRAALTGITIILSTSAPWPNILEQRAHGTMPTMHGSLLMKNVASSFKLTGGVIAVPPGNLELHSAADHFYKTKEISLYYVSYTEG